MCIRATPTKQYTKSPPQCKINPIIPSTYHPFPLSPKSDSSIANKLLHLPHVIYVCGNGNPSPSLTLPSASIVTDAAVLPDSFSLIISNPYKCCFTSQFGVLFGFDSDVVGGVLLLSDVSTELYKVLLLLFDIVDVDVNAYPLDIRCILMHKIDINVDLMMLIVYFNLMCDSICNEKLLCL